MRLGNLGAVALVLACFALCGCKVDDRYDLNNLDTEVSLFKGMEIPVGDLRRVSLAELLDLRENEHFFSDENGDYRIHVPFNEFSFDVELPIDEELLPESGKAYTIEDLPEFLTDARQSLNVELSGVEVSLDIDSGLPATATISTGVDLYRAGELTHHYGVNSLEIAPGKNAFAFNESGKGTSQGVLYQAITDMGKFFSPIPDELRINDFEVSLPDSGKNGTYPVSCQVTADSPVAFSASSTCRISIPVDKAEVDLSEIGLKKAVLSMDVYNSVPLEFSLSATAKDGKGGIQPGISAKTDVPVAAGTVDSPAHTALKVTLTADDLRFKGIVLELSAASNERVAGIVLNRNQGLELKNLVITLPDGITVKGK